MYGWGLVVILSHVLFYCGCSEINGTTGHNLEHSTKIPKSTEHTTSAPVVADQENFKFFAGIFFRDDHVCCGTYISPLFVLTTAQCVSFFPAEELTAAMSSLQFGGKGGAFVQVVLTVNHEKYGDDGGLYDISMLQLKQPFTLSSTIGIITLATKVDYTIKTCHLYGWNLAEKPKHVTINYSSPLEVVSLTLVQHEICKQKFERVNIVIDNSLVCAHTSFRACMADSGSPLVCNNELVGILSLVPGCKAVYPFAFTNIPHYSQWIQTVLQQDYVLNSVGCLYRVKSSYYYQTLYIFVHILLTYGYYNN